MKFMSHEAFMWFTTAMILALAGGWFFVDTTRLAKALRQDRSDPDVRDRIFGCVMGIIIASLGMGGVVHFHLTTPL